MAGLICPKCGEAYTTGSGMFTLISSDELSKLKAKIAKVKEEATTQQRMNEIWGFEIHLDTILAIVEED